MLTILIGLLTLSLKVLMQKVHENDDYIIPESVFEVSKKLDLVIPHCPKNEE